MPPNFKCKRHFLMQVFTVIFSDLPTSFCVAIELYQGGVTTLSIAAPFRGEDPF